MEKGGGGGLYIKHTGREGGGLYIKHPGREGGGYICQMLIGIYQMLYNSLGSIRVSKGETPPDLKLAAWT